MRNRLRHWLANERGVDLIEYMLLASFVAIVGLLGMQYIGSNMNTSYRSWDSATQGAWEMLPPTP